MSIALRDDKTIPDALGRARFVRHDPHRGFAYDLVGRLAILSEETMRVRRKPVAQTPAVQHEHAPPRTNQLHGGGKTGEAAADHDDVVVCVHDLLSFISRNPMSFMIVPC